MKNPKNLSRCIDKNGDLILDGTMPLCDVPVWDSFAFNGDLYQRRPDDKDGNCYAERMRTGSVRRFSRTAKVDNIRR